MIKDANELIARIASDLVWRRRELTDMRALVQGCQGGLRERVVIRAAVALLYAHWEGFVKKASANYLEFVASRRLPYRKLNSNFVALALRSKFLELSTSRKLASANSIAEFFCTSLDKRSNIPYKNIITSSNLSSKVFLDILYALGLDETPFSMRLNFIDTNLVNPRNHIAHGEELSLSVGEYLQLHDDVLVLIEEYRNTVENSSVVCAFERSPTA